jgi:Xaa-Pro dipeptidase
MNQQRLQRLKKEIMAQGLDGLALVPGPNMLYLSGIHAHLSERPIVLFLLADAEPAIIIPKLEAEKAMRAGILEGNIFHWNDVEGYTGAFQLACSQLALPDLSIGVESLHMRVLELNLLQRYAPGISIAHAEPIMSALRQVKDETELATMQKAALVAETAMQNLLTRVHSGLTEKQIAAMLVQELTEAGSESVAFGPIVSAGPNGASPHAVPTDRPIQTGDLLVIDWGAIVDDYPSDITRTYAVGSIGPELARIYEIVKQANAAARAVARPGATGHDLDRAARAVIDEAGYGERFIHRTGHGLGLEVHEPPYIMEGNAEPLAVGEVFTIEPGIYLPGRAGVRIEDDIVITGDGHRSLTTLSRELVHLA